MGFGHMAQNNATMFSTEMFSLVPKDFGTHGRTPERTVCRAWLLAALGWKGPCEPAACPRVSRKSRPPTLASCSLSRAHLTLAVDQKVVGCVRRAVTALGAHPDPIDSADFAGRDLHAPGSRSCFCGGRMSTRGIHCSPL